MPSLKNFCRYFIFWKQGKIIWKKFFLSMFVVLLVFLFAYYSFSFAAISEEEICLENLRRSFLEEKICHENCASKRAEDRKCLNLALNNKSKIEKEMENYIYNENVQVDFRVFLIGIFRNVYGSDNPPASLSSYLFGQSANQSVRAAILRFFNFSNLGADKNNPLSYYFSILQNEGSPELRLEAAVKIASYQGGEEYFSVSQLSIIEAIIMDKKTDKYLRQSLVLLLSDYLPVLKEETEILLQKIYNGSFPQDNISRAFAADLLEKPLPEISQEEWDSYYKR